MMSLRRTAGVPRSRSASPREFFIPQEGARKEQFMKSSGFGKMLFAILLVCLFVCASAYSQTGTSSVVGTITDPQGKPAAGAKVTLTNDATNATRSTQSSGTGAYLFDLISPPDDRLQRRAKGFNKPVLDSVLAPS